MKRATVDPALTPDGRLTWLFDVLRGGLESARREHAQSEVRFALIVVHPDGTGQVRETLDAEPFLADLEHLLVPHVKQRIAGKA